MSQGTRYSYERAYAAAQWLADLLAPACVRIDVAGSLRRRRRDVGDIDLVAAPMPDADLFGAVPSGDPSWSGITAIERRLVTEEKLIHAGGGDRQRRYAVPVAGGTIPLQLWRVPDEEYAGALMVRTGSAAFAKAFVTQRFRGGRMRDDAVFWRNRVWRIARDGRAGAVHTTDVVYDQDGNHTPAWLRAVDTPDEMALFEAAGVSYCRPEDRL